MWTAALYGRVSPRAVAGVLSGMGHVGSLGAAEVHRLGGTVVAQDAVTARHHDMPAAPQRIWEAIQSAKR